MQPSHSYKKQQRKRRRKLVIRTGIFLFFLLICGGYIATGSQKGDWFTAEGEVNQKQAKVEKNEWYLTLVNRWNPMEKSGEPELTTLTNGECVDSRIYPYLQEMFDDMRNEGVYPTVASGYRTGQEQEEIYNEKIAFYKEQGFSEENAEKEAQKWVAVPGTSEHELGLAVDINGDGIYSSGNEVYSWLEKNAYRYGFIKRYPADKTKITGVSEESWHYRYVGTDAAAEIYRKGICLEEYLGKTEKN